MDGRKDKMKKMRLEKHIQQRQQPNNNKKKARIIRNLPENCSFGLCPKSQTYINNSHAIMYLADSANQELRCTKTCAFFFFSISRSVIVCMYVYAKQARNRFHLFLAQFVSKRFC